MKKQILLKQFEYSIPPSAMASMSVKKNKVVAEHLPLMEVVIDFENGILKLTGCWYFMIAANRHNEVSWLNYHKERVQIETTIHATLPINLDDPESDGLVFPMNGVIKDGEWYSSCSGLVILDNVLLSNGLISDNWIISFYLYDLENDCEIKFKLPVYLSSINEFDN